MSKIAPKAKLADAIINEIKRMLICGDLKEGDKLPNQIVFADQLGVSRLSLREALHTLQLIGVIEQNPRVGTIIKIGNPDLWVTQMVPPLLSDTQGALELVEARRIIEIATTKLSVKKITDSDIEQLDLYVQSMDNAVKKHNYEEYLITDIAFHTLLAKSSGNRYLFSMFLSVFKLMDQFIKEYYAILPGSINDSLNMHKLIVQSLKSRDEVKTLHNFKLHLKMIEDSLTSFYSTKSDL